jgi:hypothetical protein
MSILAFLGRAMGSSQESVDVEADAIIRAFFKLNPDAAYRVTKLAMSLMAASEPIAGPSVPSKHRNWFINLLERGDNFAL